MNEKSTLSERAHLRKRFPGIDAMIAKAVGEMADYCHGESPLRVFADITPQIPTGLNVVTGWTVYIVATGTAVKAFSKSGEPEIRMPLIPDEYNPNKSIRESDAPHSFISIAEAERQAEIGITTMEKQIRQLIGGSK